MSLWDFLDAQASLAPPLVSLSVRHKHFQMRVLRSTYGHPQGVPISEVHLTLHLEALLVLYCRDDITCIAFIITV